jgi:2,4-dienoyl-CoA reductase-like NADH-dependent reductase (Old Yellow Enzyme family)
VEVAGAEQIFSAGKLAGLGLKNRVIRAGCFEGMCQSGQVTDALIEHHRRLAAGGVFCVSNDSGFMTLN